VDGLYAETESKVEGIQNIFHIQKSSHPFYDVIICECVFFYFPSTSIAKHEQNTKHTHGIVRGLKKHERGRRFSIVV
jgi:hypothetical protein